MNFNAHLHQCHENSSVNIANIAGVAGRNFNPVDCVAGAPVAFFW
jgi:hypothetical protein